MKRFYTQVDLGEADSGWCVRLDGKPMRTPSKALLRLPNARLAAALAQEWAGQGETIKADEMRLTRLATTVIDLMPTRRGDALAEASDYGGNDLLCYRAERPDDLVARQQETWQPWLDWLERRHGIALAVTTGVRAMDQDAQARAALYDLVATYDDWRLVGLHGLTTALGSLVLALAAAEGALGADAAVDASLLDEHYSREHWGEDREALRREAHLRADVVAAVHYLNLLSA